MTNWALMRKDVAHNLEWHEHMKVFPFVSVALVIAECVLIWIVVKL